MSRKGVGDTRLVTNLWPFPDGYQLWAGDCLDAAPFPRTEPFVVNPDETTDAQVDLAPIEIRTTPPPTTTTPSKPSTSHIVQTAPRSQKTAPTNPAPPERRSSWARSPTGSSSPLPPTASGESPSASTPTENKPRSPSYPEAPATVTFYANLNNTGQGPNLTSCYIGDDPSNDYGNLIQTTQAPQSLTGDDRYYSFCDASVAGCIVTKRVVARGLQWPVDLASPTFQYFDFDGLPLPATLVAHDLARVSSIEITLKVQTNTVQKDAPTNTIVQRVTLPNANLIVLVQP